MMADFWCFFGLIWVLGLSWFGVRGLVMMRGRAEENGVDGN
jgi:hypothetical protein